MNVEVMSEQELTNALIEEVRVLEISGAGIRMDISAGEAFQLVGLLQLALRHPGVGGQLHQTAYKLAKFLENKFAPYPATAEVLRRGWHQEFDRIPHGHQ